MDNVTPFPQAEKQIPTAELGGRIWELRFGHKAMRRYCSITRCNIETFDRTLIYYDNQIKLLWSILASQDPSVTEEQLDDWLDELLLEDIMTLTGDAVEAAMPKASALMRAQEEKAAALAEGDKGNPTGENTSTTA